MTRVLVPAFDAPPVRAAGCRFVALSGETMGTTWKVQLFAPHGRFMAEIEKGIAARLSRVVAQMSPWERTSDLSRFNAAPAGTWRVLPDPFFRVLNCALRIADSSGGAFDPTVGALVDLWGFGPPGPMDEPSPEAQAEAAAGCGWRRLKLDPPARRVLQPGGARLDLCGVAKGFAVDWVAQYLEAAGVSSFLVEIGGELRGLGAKPDGGPWWVELEVPPNLPGAAAGPAKTVVALHGLSVATSGDYRRFVESGGRRRHHTIDPRTGAPADTGLAAVSVLDRSCMVADGLATALMAMGMRRGLDYAAGAGIAALFTGRTEEGWEERLSPALAVMLR